jgi:hypothetical protein
LERIITTHRAFGFALGLPPKKSPFAKGGFRRNVKIVGGHPPDTKKGETFSFLLF